MTEPTIPVSVDSFEESFRDKIDIGVDVIYLVPVALVVLPAATVVMTLAQHREAIRGIQEHLLEPIVGASSTPQVMAIQGGRIQKYKPQGKAKGKGKGKDNYHYAPSVTRGVVSVSHLVDKGFTQCFTNFGLSVSMNNMLYFNAITVNGIYDIDMRDSTLPIVNSIYSISNKRTKSNFDSTYLWHCRLAHINKKHIEKLQHDGLLKSLDNEPFDQCVSCIPDKMTRKPFSHKTEKVKDVLGLIHTDVCGPLRYVSKKGATLLPLLMIIVVMVMFTYLSINMKSLKHLRYSKVKLKINSKRLLKPYDLIVVRRNRTLLNMVRSMMSLATLLLSFWDYALESAARILNMVPTKKVEKTPYELWHGKVPNLSYLKVWGCEAHVKRHAPDKLQQRSVMCIFVGYPKETMGYYFYYPHEKIVVESEHPIEEESLAPIVSQEEDVILVLEEHSLGDLNEPANYKAALSDPKFEKWLVAMNAEMQSMYDNKVWRLVVLPTNAKVVKSKWIYKKKMEMDGKKKKSIWNNLKVLLILIILGKYVSFKDSFMDLSKHQEAGQRPMTMRFGEAAFILGIKIYRDKSRRLIGLSQNAYLDKILKRYKMDNSKCGFILMQVDLHLSKSQCATTSAEINRMQNVPYASSVRCIMYAVRCIRPDVAFMQNITRRFQQNFGEAHWTAVKKILKYLINTKDAFLVYGGVLKQSYELTVIAMLDSKPIEMTQNLKLAAKEAVWIRMFIDELGVVSSNDYPIKMNCDNSATIIMAKEFGIQKGIRYFKRKYHYVRECIETGEIDIVKVHTDDNLADPFMKAFAGPKLTRHARSMGLRPASSFM
nr:hypothetical protein [Tanacetum cinerariifolium]